MPTIKRELILKTANLVRPALATAAYIPALTHISFDGEYATAYNDISAISVRCKADVGRCVPGDLLIRGLGSFGGDEIALQTGPNEELVMSSGRGAKVKLPTLKLKDFPYQPPEVNAKKDAPITIDASILKGIERCLMSVNNDPTHPAQMGVTLDSDDNGEALLFSTDNFTISRYQTSSEIRLPGDTPVILPRFFCEQLISLSRAFPAEKIQLFLLGGALFATFGEAAELFSKTPVDLEPLDFPTMMGKHVKLKGLKDQLFPIPDSWESAFGRAMLVLGSEDDKAVKVTLGVDTIQLLSTSPMGEADDEMKYESGDGDPDKPFHVDPALIIRASKSCALLGFTDRVVIMADKDLAFTHIVAHCSK
jgi:hypothetical protein